MACGALVSSLANEASMSNRPKRGTTEAVFTKAISYHNTGICLQLVWPAASFMSQVQLKPSPECMHLVDQSPKLSVVQSAPTLNAVAQKDCVVFQNEHLRQAATDACTLPYGRGPMDSVYNHRDSSVYLDKFGKGLVGSHQTSALRSEPCSSQALPRPPCRADRRIQLSVIGGLELRGIRAKLRSCIRRLASALPCPTPPAHAANCGLAVVARWQCFFGGSQSQLTSEQAQEGK